MHATDLVRINVITRVLLVYTCQQGVHPRGHVLPLRSQLDSVAKQITNVDNFSRKTRKMLFKTHKCKWKVNYYGLKEAG
jgi:hypothetical protein